MTKLHQMQNKKIGMQKRKGQKNQSSLCISIRAELVSIGTMILELN